MNRDFYLGLAARGLRTPVGTDLILHQHLDAESIQLDGERLGQVVAQSAACWQTPLAFPLMDLRLEKADLLRALGIAADQADSFHFTQCPDAGAVQAVQAAANSPFAPRNQANLDAVTFIAARTSLLPIGMVIGPFSLMTKLVRDPITPLAMAGAGVTADQDNEVKMVERCLAMAEMAVQRAVRALIAAGAKAVLVCEPAANRAYLSPKQLERNPELFSRFVIEPNLRIRAIVDHAGVDLILHDCGELTAAMVHAFATRLHPVVLSLGGSRRLWDDAALVPKDVVLFGNLPTKLFYSDVEMPVGRVRELTRELIAKMRAAAHPHIVGSECDVLSVPGATETIRHKIDVMMSAEAPR